MSVSSADNLLLVWEAAKASPFEPLIPQDSHFLIAFTLLIAGMDCREIKLCESSFANQANLI
jgi:hypothetical protein